MKHKNLSMLEKIAHGLGSFKDEVVFVGGATTVLYFDSPDIPSSTPSDDVDVVIEVASRIEFEKIEKKLGKLGFHAPLGEENHPICRKEYKGITVDIMPSDPKILGFSNPWYPEALSHKIKTRLPDGTEIFIFSLPYFFATKLAAYASRGGDDMRWSQDIEDLVTVVAGNKAAPELIRSAPAEVRKYVQSRFQELLRELDLFEEAVAGFLRGGSSAEGDTEKVVRIAQAIGTIH